VVCTRRCSHLSYRITDVRNALATANAPLGGLVDVVPGGPEDPTRVSRDGRQAWIWPGPGNAWKVRGLQEKDGVASAGDRWVDNRCLSAGLRVSPSNKSSQYEKDKVSQETRSTHSFQYDEASTDVRVLVKQEAPNSPSMKKHKFSVQEPRKHGNPPLSIKKMQNFRDPRSTESLGAQQPRTRVEALARLS
jgi:hypothetical protein